MPASDGAGWARGGPEAAAPAIVRPMSRGHWFSNMIDRFASLVVPGEHTPEPSSDEHDDAPRPIASDATPAAAPTLDRGAGPDDATLASGARAIELPAAKLSPSSWGTTEWLGAPHVRNPTGDHRRSTDPDQR